MAAHRARFGCPTTPESIVGLQSCQYMKLTNIILLICPVGRYIGCNPHHADEDTSISRMGAFTVCGTGDCKPVVFGVMQSARVGLHQHANDVQHRIEDQHWTTDLEPVANPGTEENPLLMSARVFVAGSLHLHTGTATAYGGKVKS